MADGGSGDVLDQASATADADHSILFNGGWATCDLGSQYPFAATHAFSVELWAAQTTVGDVVVMASADVAVAAGRTGFVLFVQGMNLITTARNVDGGQPSATGVVSDATKFHHIVVTYQSGVVTLYVDGGMAITAASVGGVVTKSTTFAIGRDDGYTNDEYPGRIDEVAVYDYALSAVRARVHYLAGAPDGGL